MELNKLIFVGLAVGCLAAAGAGGYLAARSGNAAQADAVLNAAGPEAKPTTAAVAESEGVIAPDPAAGKSPATSGADPESALASPRRGTTPRAPQTVAVPPRRSPSAAPETRSTSNTAPAPGSSPSSGGTMWEPRPSVEPERTPSVAPEPETPAVPELVELVIPADSVLGLQIERTISSELARVEDRVEARVTRDVRVGDRVAIPAGSTVHGSVTEVERGGKLKERARLGIRFHTVVMADGTRLNIKTDSVTREGASPASESAAKIGGAAAGGAILGAILGGGKGAVIGGTIGAAGGTAATMAGDRNPAVLPAGTTVSVRVQQPVTVTVEQ